MTFFCLLVKDEQYFANFKSIKCLKKDGNSYDDKSITKIAAINIFLTYEKLLDDKCDKNSLKTEFLLSLFKNIINKAKKKYPALYETIHLQYEEFRRLEKDNSSIEVLAESFSQFMQSIAIDEFGVNEYKLRILSDLARWIYIIDAVDDLDKDIKQNAFNPLKEKAKNIKGLFVQTDYLKTLFQLTNNVQFEKNESLDMLTINRIYFHSVPEQTRIVLRRHIL